MNLVIINTEIYFLQVYQIILKGDAILNPTKISQGVKGLIC